MPTEHVCALVAVLTVHSFKFWTHASPARLDSYAAVALGNDWSNCTLSLTTSDSPRHVPRMTAVRDPQALLLGICWALDRRQAATS